MAAGASETAGEKIFATGLAPSETSWIIRPWLVREPAFHPIHMTSFPADPPHDIAACHALIRELLADREQYQEREQQQVATIAAQDGALANKDQKLAEQEQTIVEQQTTIDRLVADLALLKRSLFGSRRERYIDDPRQGLLFNSVALPADQEVAPAEPDEQPAESTPRRTSQGRGRRVFPDFLPRTPVHHTVNDEEIPAELRNDPSVKRFFKKTGEILEYEPPKLHVIEHYQEVIARDEDTGETTMITAPKPPQLIDAFAGPSLLAYLTASRFADHLPYYRQEDILSRYGFRIGRSTQWRWMFALGQRVRPLVDLMRQLALQSLVLGVDETPVRMLSLAVLGGSVKAYLWGAVGDRDHPYDCFYFTAGRARAGPEEFLSGFRGYLQSDAYVCYEQIALSSDEILKVGCWAHARRKFEEVHFTGPSVRTHTALGYFGRLYDIEDRACSLSDQQRYELRQQEARPIVASFHEWLREHSERELPKSKLQGAIGYMTNRWDAFQRYLEHGAIPIDNNRTEASLKYAILGRKAWLFFGNENGGEAAATLFTLTKSCNRHRVDPYAYLCDVYQRLPTMRESELETLLPDRWIQEHPEHRIQERVDEARERARRTRARRAARRRKVA
jgi:transposase